MPTAHVTAPPDAAADIVLELAEEGHAACVNRVRYVERSDEVGVPPAFAEWRAAATEWRERG